MANQETNIDIHNYRLSNRKAEVAAYFLNEKGKGTIQVSACRSQTAATIARRFLGTKATLTQVESLAKEILVAVGVLKAES